MDTIHPDLLALTSDSSRRSLSGKDLLPLSKTDAWLVLDGCLHLFVSEVKEGSPLGRRHYLATFEAGDVLFPMAAEEVSVALLAVSDGAAEVARIPGVGARENGDAPSALTRAMADWFSKWMEIFPASVEVAEIVQSGQGTSSLRPFSTLIVKELRAKLSREDEEEAKRFRIKQSAEASAWSGAFEKAASILGSGRTPVKKGARHPMLTVVEIVADSLRIPLKPHPEMEREVPVPDPLEAIASVSNFRKRRVLLEGNWFREDSGHLIGFLEEGPPVALIPYRKGYRMHRPDTGERIHVTATVAREIKPEAYVIHRPLPSGKLGLVDIIRFGVFGSRRDLVAIVLLSLGSALLGLFVPWATKQIFDNLIPSAEREQLLILMLALFVAALGGALFQLTRSFALLRVETRADSGLQSGIWSRLLDLPVPFFRDYSVGDLSQRVMGIQQIRAALSQSTINTILTSVFSLTQVIMIVQYGGSMAPWAFGLVALALAVSLLSGFFTVVFQRRELKAQGRVSSTLFQLLSGIKKLKVTASEKKAYLRWLGEFSEQRRLAFQSAMVQNGFAVFQSILPVGSSMLIFYLAFGILQDPDQQISTGQFLAFNAAFGTLIAAVLTLGSSVLMVLDVVPLLERSKPILEALPEVDEAGRIPADLKGEIEVGSVCFRYEKDGPAILNQVSLRLRPGEFGAVVGPSGSGKSTLLRILLGFERPESGSIYYDGQDLAGLDVRKVRRQIGTVLQNAKILQGDIFTNIVGSAHLTLEDAWQAAEQAGFAEEIRRMPMQMHTVLDENAMTLSGGQRQRLIIARALARRPRIIFFDEATSALDNRTQRIVSESLEAMSATRLVIAHRLSTIRGADRIFVLKDGRIVETGNYSELMEANGVFAGIASRQIS